MEEASIMISTNQPCVSESSHIFKSQIFPSQFVLLFIDIPLSVVIIFFFVDQQFSSPHA